MSSVGCPVVLATTFLNGSERRASVFFKLVKNGVERKL